MLYICFRRIETLSNLAILFTHQSVRTFCVWTEYEATCLLLIQIDSPSVFDRVIVFGQSFPKIYLCRPKKKDGISVIVDYIQKR